MSYVQLQVCLQCRQTGPIAALSKALSLALPRLTILGPNRVASLRALLGVSTDQLPATSREDLPEALRFPFSGAEALVMILVQRKIPPPMHGDSTTR
jgi:hypothetical protein